MSTLPAIGGTADPPRPPNAPDSRPGAVGFWFGAGAILLGLGLLVAVAVSGFGAARRALAFPVPLEVDGGTWIEETGGKVVFVVGPPSATTGVVPDSVSITVTGPEGSFVAVTPYTGRRSTTGVDPASGLASEAVAVATFDADRRGRYRIDAENLPVGSTLGIGRGAEIDAGFVVVGILGGGLLVLGGIVIVIVTAVRRSRRSAPPYPPTGGPAWAHPYGPSPYRSGGHAPTGNPPAAPFPMPGYPPAGAPWPAPPPAPPGWPGPS